MRFKDFIILILTLVIFGCDGSYQSNDDEMVSELESNQKKFVAVGYSGTILSSSNGDSWTLRKSETTQYLSSVAKNSDNFVTVFGVTSDILISKDGESWELKSQSNLLTTSEKIIYLNNMFITV